MFQPLRFVTAGILLSGAATFYASPVRSTAADLPVKSKTILTTVKPAPLKQPAGTFSVLPLESSTVSRRVDALISLELSQAKVVPASKTSDEDFLRRVTFDLAGTAPTPAEVDVFGIDPDPQKRSRVIDCSRLTIMPEIGRNIGAK